MSAESPSQDPDQHRENEETEVETFRFEGNVETIETVRRYAEFRGVSESKFLVEAARIEALRKAAIGIKAVLECIAPDGIGTKSFYALQQEYKLPPSSSSEQEEIGVNVNVEDMMIFMLGASWRYNDDMEHVKDSFSEWAQQKDRIGSFMGDSIKNYALRLHLEHEGYQFRISGNLGSELDMVLPRMVEVEDGSE